MTQQELVQGMTDLKTQGDKILTEVQNVINTTGQVSPELEAAFNNLKTTVQAIDDLIPDVA